MSVKGEIPSLQVTKGRFGVVGEFVAVPLPIFGVCPIHGAVGTTHERVNQVLCFLGNFLIDKYIVGL